MKFYPSQSNNNNCTLHVYVSQELLSFTIIKHLHITRGCGPGTFVAHAVVIAYVTCLCVPVPYVCDISLYLRQLC